MYTAARLLTDKPLKVSVGAGPPNLTYHVDFNHPDSTYKEARALAEDLVPIFNEDLKDLVAHGADYIQIEDLGAWMLAMEGDNDWVLDVLNAWIDGVDARSPGTAASVPATATRSAPSRTRCPRCWSAGRR